MNQNPPPFGTPFPFAPQPIFPTATNQDTLIIHHLSDLHRSRTEGGRHALSDYARRLYNMPKEREPHLIIISGDLTLTGTRDELHEAAEIIRNMTLRWDDAARRQHVFVVPGPHDIDWSNTSDKVSSLEAFHQEFHSFCTPLLMGRDGKLVSGPEPYCYSSANHFLVYTLNTLYMPESLPQPIQKPLEETLKHYRAHWKERAKQQSRQLGVFNEGSRNLFLETTEPLIARDNGFVRQADVERFTQLIQGLKLEDQAFNISNPGDDVAHPLKILVTHHPLIAFTGRNGGAIGAAEGAGALLRAARNFDFHVVLHGHAHEPHLLSDLPIEAAGMGKELPLLQIGAGSLGGAVRETPTYNEIVATRSRTSGRWALNLTPINLNSEVERTPFRFTFLPPTGEANALQPMRPNEHSMALHQEFERRLGHALRQFSEEVENVYQTDIPTLPLGTIRDLIKEVIFQGVETRVGLALKQRHTDGVSIVLHNKYIVPDVQFDDQYIHPFPYPDTIAAWSLIQGETLLYPTQVKDKDTLVNFDWLQRSGKFQIVQHLLADAAQRGNARALELKFKLENHQLRLVDMFQPSPMTSQPTRFGSFISVPVPLRPTSAASPRLREIGVLNVDIVDSDIAQPGAAFTPDRVEMLRTLAYLIDLILSTADKLGRPHGRWIGI